jgi:hypothetical protein
LGWDAFPPRSTYPKVTVRFEVFAHTRYCAGMRQVEITADAFIQLL